MKKVLTEQPEQSQICLADIDWSRFLKANLGLQRSSRMKGLATDASAAQTQGSSIESLAARIVLEKDAEKRGEMLLEYIFIPFASWTGIQSTSELDLNTSLHSYGIDSTAALTLKMQLESTLQVSFEVNTCILRFLQILLVFLFCFCFVYVCVYFFFRSFFLSPLLRCQSLFLALQVSVFIHLLPSYFCFLLCFCVSLYLSVSMSLSVCSSVSSCPCRIVSF